MEWRIRYAEIRIPYRLEQKTTNGGFYMPIIEYDTYKQKLGALEPRLDTLAAALDLKIQ